MKPTLQNGFLIIESLFEKPEEPQIDYKELGLKEPEYWAPENCDWKTTAIRVSEIVAINEQINTHDPNGKYCKIETNYLEWSVKADMMDVIALLQ